MYLLDGVVQHNDWGCADAIAGIRGVEPSGRPEAEYWLGAHPKAPSRIVGREAPDGTLDRVVAEDPRSILGPDLAERFGQLPFLLKILAADRPLSIQAHPDRAQAAAGFAREEAAGLDPLAPDRNYRDDNHKPELICAITPFEAKCGFRAVGATRRLLDRFRGPGFDELRARLDRPVPDEQRLADALAWLLRLDPDRQAALVADAVEQASNPSGSDEYHRELDWTVRIDEAFPGDIGVVVALLLNHLTLQPGQAVFLGAGNLHAYLQGVGIELMANSDNVLRGGLTNKHIDVEELLAVVSSEPIPAPIQTAAGAVHVYHSPVPEFRLTRIASTGVGGTIELEQPGPSIVLVTSGEVELIDSDGGSMVLGAGQSAFVADDEGPFRIVDRAPGRSLAWAAAVGHDPV